MVWIGNYIHIKPADGITHLRPNVNGGFTQPVFEAMEFFSNYIW